MKRNEKSENLQSHEFTQILKRVVRNEAYMILLQPSTKNKQLNNKSIYLQTSITS